MTYLATWIEGEEVFYRIVDEKTLQEMWEPEKHIIVIQLS